jgi:hypothetical protein
MVCREPSEDHGMDSDDGMIVQTAVAYQARYMCARDSRESMSVERTMDGEERGGWNWRRGWWS